jgi:arsenical pump membrane protein
VRDSRVCREACPLAPTSSAVRACRRRRPGRLGDLKQAVNPFLLAMLFAVAASIGTLARLWHGPSRLMAGANAWATAWIAAGAAGAVNNLPAAVLLSARLPAHLPALLLGLDLGPNLVVTGALSAVLWLRIARAEGAAPSALTYSKIGLVLVPLSITAGLLALQVTRGGF